MMDKKDGLWLDMTDKSPYPKRKNGYTLIHKTDGEATKKEEEGQDTFTEA